MIETHDVDPDIVVEQDPRQAMKGCGLQLERDTVMPALLLAAGLMPPAPRLIPPATPGNH